MKLSDVWLAAMAKDPKGAVRSFGDAIAEIEVALVPEPTDKNPPPATSEVSPRTGSKAQPPATSEPAPEAPPDQTPRAAE